MKLAKKEVVLVLVLLLLIPLVYSLSGSGGGYNLSIGQRAQLGAYNGTGGGYLLRITMGQAAVGNGTGGDYTVWLGYIHMLNSAPTIDNAAVHTDEADSLEKAYTNNTLICEVNASDVDGSGQTIGVNITWYKNGLEWASDNQSFSTTLSGTTYRLNTTAQGDIEPEKTTRGETWKCSAKVSDSQDTSAWKNSTGFYIYNAPPTLDRSKPTTKSWNEDTTGTLNLSQYFTDIDGDALKYYIHWASNMWGGGFFSRNNITITINNNTGIVTLVPKENVTGTMYISFTATDSVAANDPGQTNTQNMTLQIGAVNDPPWATDAYIYPHSPEPTDTLSCEYTFNDLESDTELTAGAAFKWYLQNGGSGPFSQIPSETGKTLTSEHFDLNDVLICSVKPMDSHSLAAKYYTNSTINRIVSAAETTVEANIVIGIG